MVTAGLIAILAVGAIAMAGGGGDDGDLEDITSPDPELEEDPQVDPVAIDDETLSLVLADRDDGSVVDAASIVSKGDRVGETFDRDYMIRPGDSGGTDFEVAYDADTTFHFEVDGDVESVTVGLNSNVDVPYTEIETTHRDVFDEDGTPIIETTKLAIYDGAAEINLQITNEQVGVHVSKIDLSNPADQLNFQFADDLVGNLHLITQETSTGSAQTETNAVRNMYLIHTTDDITELTGAEAEAVIAQDGTAEPGFTLLAEIHLGEAIVQVTDFELTIFDFLNEAPQFSTNTDFTSLAISDASGSAGGTSGSGSTGGTGLDPLPEDNGSGGTDDPFVLDLDGDGVPDFNLDDLGDFTDQDLLDLVNDLDLPDGNNPLGI